MRGKEQNQKSLNTANEKKQKLENDLKEIQDNIDILL
jgi:hypothetical protein